MALRRFRYGIVPIAVILLAGCGGLTSEARSPAAPGSSASAPRLAAPVTSPEGLVGRWRVDAAGEQSGTVLRIGGDLSLWRKCWDFFGDWMADGHGRFVAGVWAYSPACQGPGPAGPVKPAWLIATRGYRAAGRDWLLLDSAGHVVARLSPGGKPFPNPNVAPQVWAPPKLDSAQARKLRQAVPLPPSARAATTAEVIGKWVPRPGPSASRSGAYITFRGDGSWIKSDGCNIYRGQWSLGAGGSLLSVSSGSTLVGCLGQGEVPMMTGAMRLGFSGAVLVVRDAGGAVIGQLIRA